MIKVPSTFRRKLLRGCAWIVGLAALLLACGYAWITAPLDTSPLLGSPVAVATESSLRTAAAAARARPVEAGALRVGWGSAPITPPLGTPTYGYFQFPRGGITSIEDEVLAHALAVAVGDGPPLVFLSADICLWVSDVSALVADEVRDVAPRERIYFGATHNHSGPGGYADGPGAAFSMGGRDPELVELIVGGAVQAIRAAVADLTPGGVREVARPAPEYLRARGPSEGPIDDELLLVEYRKADGRRCALVSFGAHATTIAQLARSCSGDYPGALVRGLRERGYDGALFFASGTGQSGPKLEGHRTHRTDTLAAYALGEALAERVAAMSADSPADFASETRLAVLRGPVALPDYRLPFLGRALELEVAAWLTGRPRAVAHVHALRLGHTVYVGHSFEFSAVVARRLKERARAGGGRLVVTSFNGDHNYYVVPEDLYGQGYESTLTLFGPGLAPYLERVTEQVYDCMRGLDGAEEPVFDLGG